MRAIFGVVSLLVVVALIGLLAGRQLKAMRVAAPAAATGAASGTPAPTVREQSIQVQDKVRSDVAKALEQGARKEEADK